MKRKPPRSSESETEQLGGGMERLQKILSAAGLGSRRECEELITDGRVEVDRKVVSQLGAKADPHKQEIKVDGQKLHTAKLVHYLVNKPNGVVTTNNDPSGRPRVIDLVPDRQRVFAVGRLDLSSEGLILVTNDGELANRLTHPRYGVEKTYQVEVAGKIDPQELAKLRKGVHLSEGFAKVVHLSVKKERPKSTQLEMILSEGKNREVRRIFAKVGHKVLRLRRIALGPLRLAELPLGGFRALSRQEVKALWDDSSPAAYRERLKIRAARTPQRDKKFTAPPAEDSSPETEIASPVTKKVARAVEEEPVRDLPPTGKFATRTRTVIGDERPRPPRKKAAARPPRQEQRRSAPVKSGKKPTWKRSKTR